MSEKYIRKNSDSYLITYRSKTYGKFQSLEVAVFVRDLLVENGWDMNLEDEIFNFGDHYILVKNIDNKLHCLGQFTQKPDKNTISKLTKQKIRNPNNSKYGLNISKIFDEYVIKKQIAGDEYIFGVFDNLEDAKFSRNFLLDHMWNVNEFGEIEYCDESDSFKIVYVFDDRIYILGSFKTKFEAQMNLENSKSEFLNKIYKHSHGLGQYPHLDILGGHLEEIEEEFNMKASDDVWDLKSDVENPLSEIIFNLTPWQKTIYDSVEGNFTFDELKKSLIRYKSKNFDEKIMKNLDELINLNLVEKLDDGTYRKR